MQSLKDLKSIEEDLIQAICRLYEKTNRRGSRHSQPEDVKKPNYNELIEDVKDLDKLADLQ